MIGGRKKEAGVNIKIPLFVNFIGKAYFIADTLQIHVSVSLRPLHVWQRMIMRKN